MDCTTHTLKKMEEKKIEKPEGEVLYLGSNQIKRIGTPKNPTKLKMLYLGNNRIKRIERLENPINLVKLDVSYNQIIKI